MSTYFNNKQVKQLSSQNHLVILLDTKFNFQDHLKILLNKSNKIIRLLRKLRNVLPRASLLMSIITCII